MLLRYSELSAGLAHQNFQTMAKHGLFVEKSELVNRSPSHSFRWIAKWLLQIRDHMSRTPVVLRREGECGQHHGTIQQQSFLDISTVLLMTCGSKTIDVCRQNLASVSQQGWLSGNIMS